MGRLVSRNGYQPDWLEDVFCHCDKRNGAAELEVETAKLPDSSLSALQAKVADLKAQQTALQEKLKDLAATVISDLKAAQHQYILRLSFRKSYSARMLWPTIN